MEMNFATVWESIADAIPNAPAITHGDTTRTWAEYTDRAARVAGALDADGAAVDSATIISSVKSDLAGYKAPKSVIVVDQVPRAPNGKADYRRAKEHAEAAT